MIKHQPARMRPVRTISTRQNPASVEILLVHLLGHYAHVYENTNLHTDSRTGTFPTARAVRRVSRAHKRLLSEDFAYHRRWQRYIAAVVCLAIIPVVGWVAAVVLAFRQQEFQNQRIGHVLQSVA